MGDLAIPVAFFPTLCRNTQVAGLLSLTKNYSGFWFQHHRTKYHKFIYNNIYIYSVYIYILYFCDNSHDLPLKCCVLSTQHGYGFVWLRLPRDFRTDCRILVVRMRSRATLAMVLVTKLTKMELQILKKKSGVSPSKICEKCWLNYRNLWFNLI